MAKAVYMCVHVIASMENGRWKKMLSGKFGEEGN